MKIKARKRLIALYIVLFSMVIFGCGNKEEKNQDAAKLPQSTSPDSISSSNEAKSKNIAISVDGKYLTKLQLEKEVKEFIDANKDKIPQDKRKEIQADIKKQSIDNFIIRTVLESEVEKRKIQINDKEIDEAIKQFKASMPPGKKITDFLKEGKLTMEKLKEDIAFNIKVKQLVQMELGNKAKPSAKEINKFYNDNKDKLVVPESVHVRHILVAIDEGDDEKIKAEKKTKIENLHKQLMEGADFADLAGKYSDCPSKENGGDLGVIKRGETVQQFEDAAFSQEKDVIGPVVSTEYGHHIIQVLEHNKAKTITLAETKKEISNYLEQQKQMEAFSALVKKLRENAKIVIYEN